MAFNKSFFQNSGYTLLLAFSITYASSAIADEPPPPPPPPPPPSADITPPSVPTSLNVTKQCSSTQSVAHLTWNASTDYGGGTVAGYRVTMTAQSLSGGPSATGIFDVLTTFYDVTLFEGNHYTVSVSAFDNVAPPNTNVSQSSSPVSFSGCNVNYSCDGFFEPLDDEDVAIAVKAKSKRAIPIKAQLRDSGNNIIGVDDLAQPPVVNVMFKPEVGDAVPVDEDDLVPKGESSFGNKFSYDADTLTWQYNLDTSPLSKGTYTITMTSGDPSYQILPTCTGKFERQ